MIFCRSIYVKKVMKLLAFIFEQPSYYMMSRSEVGITPCIRIDKSLVVYISIIVM